MATRTDGERRADAIEHLVQRLEASPDPASRAAARELVVALMAMHAEGLSRVLELIDADDYGAALIDRVAADPVVAPLLVLHGLHPADLETRVRGALDKTRPYLQSHGGNVQIVSVAPDGTVRLALEGSCHGCPSSQLTLKSAIEEAIFEAAPDVTSLIVEGVLEPLQADAFVAINAIPRRHYDACPTGVEALPATRSAP